MTQPQEYFTIKLNIKGDGKILTTPSKVFYKRGELVNIEALPENDSNFIQWQGDIKGSFAVCNIRITSNFLITAIFAKQMHPIEENQTNIIKYDNTTLSTTEEVSELNSTLTPELVNTSNHLTQKWIDDLSTPIEIVEDLSGRFEIREDGTVIDYDTTLMWTYRNYPEKISLVKAKKLNTNFLKYRNWRIPSPDELRSIAIHLDKFFLRTPIDEYYWTNIQSNNLGTAINGAGRIIDAKRPSDKYLLKLVRDTIKFSIQTKTTGTGSGQIDTYISNHGLSKVPRITGEYPVGTCIEVSANANTGSLFKQWHGDCTSTKPICRIIMDSAKSIVAEFQLLRYQLNLQTTGSGEGKITSNSTSDQYLHGSVVVLHATAADGSLFKRWGGDASGSAVTASITLNSEKTVTAEFVRLFPLNVSAIGKGRGLVARSVHADAYEDGSTVELTAVPGEGHLFVGWHGDAKGNQPVCMLTMNRAKTVSAKFAPKKSFHVDVMCEGSGLGAVWPCKAMFWQGSVIELLATPEPGSVFDGWSGDVTSAENKYSVTVNTNLSITATFTEVVVPTTDIEVTFDGITHLTDSTGANRTVFLFTVANQSERQHRITIPLAGYVNSNGEEVAQSGWVQGMIDGEKGATLRPGTFRKMGLVFNRVDAPTLKAGEHLYLTLQQSKPPLQLELSFRCTDTAKSAFTLASATVEDKAEAPPDKDARNTAAAWTSRMQQLETEMQEALRRLNATPPAAPPPFTNPAAANSTLLEVLAWLCTQTHVPLAVLSQKLRPLDLMPSAVINDVNERAFDVAGEAALDEAQGTVSVQRGVLLQVLAAW